MTVTSLPGMMGRVASTWWALVRGCRSICQATVNFFRDLFAEFGLMRRSMRRLPTLADNLRNQPEPARISREELLEELAMAAMQLKTVEELIQDQARAGIPPDDMQQEARDRCLVRFISLLTLIKRLDG